MPALLPAPMPRFSCSTSLTSGKRSRTSAAVPSVEPLSTTTVSCPRTESRQRSTWAAALYVTTTTETASPMPASAVRDRHRAPAQALPQDHDETRHGEQQRRQRERQPDRQGGVGVDADPREEADEEGLADAEAVDR